MGKNELDNDSIFKTNENKSDDFLEEITSNNRDAKFAYEKLLIIRDLDNQLLWTRINILIVFQGVLIAAVAASFQKLLQDYYVLFLVLTVFGLFSSVVLHRLAKGGSWWVSHWEKKLRTIESAAIGNIEIFRNHPHDEKKMVPEWKETSYISVRKTMIMYTSVMPFLWATFLIISIIFKFFSILP